MKLVSLPTNEEIPSCLRCVLTFFLRYSIFFALFLIDRHGLINIRSFTSNEMRTLINSGQIGLQFLDRIGIFRWLDSKRIVKIVSFASFPLPQQTRCDQSVLWVDYIPWEQVESHDRYRVDLMSRHCSMWIRNIHWRTYRFDHRSYPYVCVWRNLEVASKSSVLVDRGVYWPEDESNFSSNWLMPLWNWSSSEERMSHAAIIIRSRTNEESSREIYLLWMSILCSSFSWSKSSRKLSTDCTRCASSTFNRVRSCSFNDSERSTESLDG